MTSATFDKVKGGIKEGLGNATGNQDLEADGKTDQAKGSLKQAAQNVKEGAEKVVASVKNAVATASRDHAEKAEQKTGQQ